MNIRRWVHAVLILTCTIHLPARAATDGDLCSGLAMLICAPIALIQVLTPKTSYEHLSDAIDAGDLETVKHFLKRGHDMPEPQEVLRLAVSSYLSKFNPEYEAGRLDVIRYLLDNVVDVSGEKGTKYLQMTVWDASYVVHKTEDSWPRRLALAKLLLAHGTSASAIELNECERCDVDNEFVPLMIAHGADPNHVSRIDPALLDILLSQDKFEAAERLVRLGADPNGSVWDQRSMLTRIAQGCYLKRKRTYMPLDRLEATSKECIDKVIARTTFAIRQLGADPNGKATPEIACVTPYATAREEGSDALANALLSLGASPDYARRCLAMGTPRVTPH